MPMDNVTLENTQQSISSRDAKSVASVMVNGKWVNLSDTLEQANVKSDVGTVAKQVAAQQEVVSNAVSVADSAQSAADAAVASAQVTSDAVSAIASATAEAKQGANDALSRAKSAWDVATNAKSAVTDFDPLLKSAQSDASKALTQIADTASALSDAKLAFNSDVAEAKNLANTAQATADSAVKSASSVADDLTAVANQAKTNVNGITKVTSDVGLLQTTVANNTGNISTIQATAKQIQQAVSDNAGNITVAKQTADSAATVASDARSNATVAIQTASQASITAQNASGQAASAVLTANGAMTTASDAKSDATVAIQTASGASLTATNANSDATVAKQTASEAKVQASNAESDFAQLSIRAGKIEASVANNSGAIANVQQTANGLTTTVADIKANGGGRNLITGTSRDLQTAPYSVGNTYGGFLHVFSSDELSSLAGNQVTTRVFIHNPTTHTVNLVIWTVGGGFGVGTDVPAGTDGYSTITAYNITSSDTAGDISIRSYTENVAISGVQYKELKLEKGTVAHDWSPAPEDLQNQFTQIKQSIDGVTTTINDPKTGLNATYQTAAGNATTISNVKSDVYQLETTASGLTSRVGNLESKTNTQETAIEQNKNAITLKADQTTVDKINGTVSQMQSTLTVQAGQIQEKVTSSQVTGMLAGYATQDYTQSLITQEAGTINESITNLDAKYSAKDGVNLQLGTGDCSFPISSYNATVTIENYDDHTKMFHVKGTNGFYTSYNAGTSFVPTVGETYTVSADVKGGGTTSGDFFKYEGADSCSLGTVTLTDTWQRISNTVHIGSVRGQWIFYLNNNAGDFYVKHIKIERGSVATPWTPAPSDNATVTQVQSLTASIDGLQSNVTNLKNDTSSQITQLSTAVQSKVSQGDYNSQINQLKSDINLRVQKGDVVSQINEEAGGNTLIQVANGKGKLALNASSVVFTGDAFIPDAYISTINADKLMFYGSDGTSATMGASVAQYDDDKTKSTINLQYSGGIEIHSSDQQGSILTMHDNTIRLASKTWGDNSNPYQYSGFYAAPNYSLMNTYHKDGTTSGVAIDDNRIWIYGDSKDQQLGALQADVGWYSINGKTGLLTGNQISLKSASTQVALTDRNINIENTADTNSKNYDVAIHIKGWAEMTGWFTCMGLTQTSLLSTKTRIEPLDTAKALELINSADVATYQYKQEVAHGGTKRHASVIIDDVNDVARYHTPDEIISEDRQGRNDGDIVGYLMGAVQELTKKLKTLESKVG